MSRSALDLPAPATPPHLAALAGALAAALSRLKPGVTRQDVLRNLEPSARPERGEIAFKTFAFTKPLGVSPKELADAVIPELVARPDLVRGVSADLPYLNIALDYGPFQAALGAPGAYYEGAITRLDETILIEHSQPNTHKELHVGHLRNTVLGDSLYRLLKVFHQRVLAVNYHGDEGVHVARALWYLKRNYPQLPDPEEPGAWLGQLYPQAIAAIEAAKGTDDEPVFQREASQLLQALKSGSGDDHALWLKTRGWSLRYFEKIYDWLGVRFDAEWGESDVSAASQRMVDEYLARGVFIVSEGAVGCDLSDVDLGFCMLRRSDGTGLYATKDVELLLERFERYGFSTCIYVVDTRQSRHFEQVFHTVSKMGFPVGERCIHLGYDVVQTREGPISSRRGGAMAAHLVMRELTDVAAANIAQRAGDEAGAAAIARAALRYGMLKVDPDKKITFDLAEWVSFEGNTGPYLQYTFARIRSILRKWAEQPGGAAAEPEPSFAPLAEPQERVLLDRVLRLPLVLHEAASKLKPSLVCNYFHAVSQVFNSYYNQVPILSQPDPAVRAARIELCRTLEGFYRHGFALMGIDPIERL